MQVQSDKALKRASNLGHHGNRAELSWISCPLVSLLWDYQLLVINWTFLGGTQVQGP